MPVLSAFYGIIVRMYSEGNGPHNMPHVHVSYSGDKAVVTLDGRVLEGDLPRNKMRLLLAWLEIHQDELKANWELIVEGDPVFKIEPLR